MLLFSEMGTMSAGLKSPSRGSMRTQRGVAAGGLGLSSRCSVLNGPQRHGWTRQVIGQRIANGGLNIRRLRVVRQADDIAKNRAIGISVSTINDKCCRRRVGRIEAVLMAGRSGGSGGNIWNRGRREQATLFERGVRIVEEFPVDCESAAEGVIDLDHILAEIENVL